MTAHREEEEDEKVDDEDRPVHRDVKHLEERADKCDDCGARSRQPLHDRQSVLGMDMATALGMMVDVPKLPFRQAADEWPELVVLGRG